MNRKLSMFLIHCLTWLFHFSRRLEFMSRSQQAIFPTCRADRMKRNAAFASRNSKQRIGSACNRPAATRSRSGFNFDANQFGCTLQLVCQIDGVIAQVGAFIKRRGS